MTMSELRLTAFDTADLEIISAHLQDAVLKVGDIRFLKKAGKFALIANRFLWQTQKPPYERRQTGLSFDRVLSAKSQRTHFFDSVLHPAMHEHDLIAFVDRTIENPDISNGTAIGIELRIEDQTAECAAR